MLALIIQSGMACYILTRFERGTVLSNIAIPIFVAGFLKCMERIWILRFSGFKQFVDSALSETPPKKRRSKGHKLLDDHLTEKRIISRGRYLHRACLSFKMFLPLFADIDLRIYKELSDIFNLQSMSAKEAFQMVATELGFLYDVLYTKTIILDIQLGFTFRFIYFLSSTGALLAFHIANINKQHDHSEPEICITYLLLYGACVADSIAVISHFFSSWTLVWFIRTPKTWQRLPKCLRSLITSYLERNKSIQGVKYMAQHSLLDYCISANVNKFNAAINKMVGAKNISKISVDIRRQAWVDMGTWAQVDGDLKDLIFSRLQHKRRKSAEGKFEFSCLSRLVNEGASEVLEDNDLERNVHDEIQWSLNKVEFTHSLLLWHIATEILFYYFENKCPGCSRRRYQQISKKLSNYMMHLLVRRSFMLPSGISKLRYRDTCFDAVNFFGPHVMKIDSKDLGIAATTLLFLDFEPRTIPLEVEGEGRNKSVFFEGCKLAQQLKSFAETAIWDPEELWEMISCVWMEMLFSAAYGCDWKEHEYQLGHGGELLTDVALLMAHHGLSKHLLMTETPEQYKMYDYSPPWDWDNIGQIAYYLA